MATRYEVCPPSELQPGERKIIDAGNLSVGVFNIDGEYYAINNVCPHQLAPLAMGDLTGLVTAESTDPDDFEYDRPGEILTCPWHNWEFDVKTGQSVFNPHKMRTRTFDVEVEEVEGEVPCGGCSAGDREDVEAREYSEEEREAQESEYGTSLAGDEPPVETYDVEVEDEMVVVYV